ncbi:outer membrane protein assembly factor BamB family protein [Nocardioides bruguierae]|uniref:PQQ-like beta-propeller repeat protein n=1 Tax=Nocardioides bruguierae TaxID=2945102 RepID=A0A9X2DAL7_9ACTN|nr:PQQ-binding-like beta-propeller repeat protein [Nocardioides bruguierae]MCM0622408.1 PQQ-like beta-propeller repeat protein [Nocardioides bruguierae]
MSQTPPENTDDQPTDQPTDEPAQEPAEVLEGASTNRRGLRVLIGFVLLVVVAGGIAKVVTTLTAEDPLADAEPVFTLGGDGWLTPEGRPRTPAVDEVSEVAWTWTSAEEESVDEVWPLGRGALLWTGQDLVALDADGEEAWRQVYVEDTPDDFFAEPDLYEIEPVVSDDHSLVWVDSEDGAAMLDAESGETLWSDAGGVPVGDLVVVDRGDDGLLARDAATGDERWGADDPVAAVTAWGDRLYVVTADLDVLEHDAATGEVTADLGTVRGAAGDEVAVAAAGDLLGVGVGRSSTVLSTDGTVLYERTATGSTAGDDIIEPESWGAGLMAVDPTIDSDLITRDGKRTVQPEGAAWWPVGSRGDDVRVLALGGVSGQDGGVSILDGSLSEIATVRALPFGVADGQALAITEKVLRAVSLEDGDELWQVRWSDLGDGAVESGVAVPAIGGVLVNAEDSVTMLR